MAAVDGTLIYAEPDAVVDEPLSSGLVAAIAVVCLLLCCFGVAIGLYCYRAARHKKRFQPPRLTESKEHAIVFGRQREHEGINNEAYLVRWVLGGGVVMMGVVDFLFWLVLVGVGWCGWCLLMLPSAMVRAFFFFFFHATFFKKFATAGGHRAGGAPGVLAGSDHHALFVRCHRRHRGRHHIQESCRLV